MKTVSCFCHLMPINRQQQSYGLLQLFILKMRFPQSKILVFIVVVDEGEGNEKSAPSQGPFSAHIGVIHKRISMDHHKILLEEIRIKKETRKTNKKSNRVTTQNHTNGLFTLWFANPHLRILSKQLDFLQISPCQSICSMKNKPSLFLWTHFTYKDTWYFLHT